MPEGDVDDDRHHRQREIRGAHPWLAPHRRQHDEEGDGKRERDTQADAEAEGAEKQ